MTERVDFYVLSSESSKLRLNFACRLAEKAYLRNLRVTILSGAAAEANALDELLWTFSDRSFVPHQLIEGERSTDSEAPVQLTLTTESSGSADLLVNLTDQLPANLERFARVAEIIDANPERRRLGRERFRAYRERKLTLETHSSGDSADI